jgi:uncharacterized protein
MTHSNYPFQPLIAAYDHHDVKQYLREPHEVLGFICAIAASPSLVELHDWFPFLWKNNVDPSFADEEIAAEFATAALQFQAHCQTSYRQSKGLNLPVDDWLHDDSQFTAEGSCFASGYLLASHAIEVHWQALNLQQGSEPEQLLQTTMLLLSKMATPNTDESEMQVLFAQLPEAKEIVRVLPQLLMTLGNFSVSVQNDE